MTNLTQDPINNATNGGIRHGIQNALDNKCFSSAVILIYAGIDAMAFLAMPEDQEDVKKENFIQWADRYIKFPCREQLNGADLYVARCGMLHNYSTESRMTRKGECRKIGYADKMVPEVAFNPTLDNGMVLVSVPALGKAFLQGNDQFLVDIFSNSNSGQLVEKRILKLIHTMPFNTNRCNTDSR